MCEQPLIHERTLEEVTKLVLRAYLNDSYKTPFMCNVADYMFGFHKISSKQKWAFTHFMRKTIEPYDTLTAYMLVVLSWPHEPTKREKAKFILQKLRTIPDLRTQLF